MQWQRFFALWQRLLWWERQLLLWFAYLSLTRRALLPAMSVQAGGMAVIIWMTPNNPLLWCLAFVVSFVYALMFQAVVRR